MADEEMADTLMRTEDDDSDSGSSSDDEQVEWLATGREKRSTAGNRLSTLMQQEGEDDDLELLFAEDEDDVGFEVSDEDGSDVQMDSSDDDEDQGPAAGADDLEGEKELQRQARAEKTKKRKANDHIPAPFRKKVKIEPAARDAPPVRPKKKSERTSWIPTAAEAPIRASDRRTTKKSKEQLYLQMLDREKKRLRQLANMEKAAKRKGADKPKELTQEDRLAEAARVEKRNAKSLNRWEEAEKLREEEQRARLAALNNRKMDGPVLTWWSGVTEWVGGRLKHIGKKITIEEKEKPQRRKKGEAETSQQDISVASPQVNEKAKEDSHAPDKSTGPSGPDEKPDGRAKDSSKTPLPSTIAHTILIPHQTRHSSPRLQQAQLNGSAPLPGFQLAQPQPQPDADSTEVKNPTASLIKSDSQVPVQPSAESVPRSVPSTTEPFTFAPPAPLIEVVGEAQPLKAEYETRNCIIFENFEEGAMKQKDVPLQVLFGPGKTFTKIHKPSMTLCAITNRPAKFRDPASGLPYYNAFAYREIQALRRGDYRWSSLLQAYVGQARAARGVPRRFVDPTAPRDTVKILPVTPSPAVPSPVVPSPAATTPLTRKEGVGMEVKGAVSAGAGAGAGIVAVAVAVAGASANTSVVTKNNGGAAEIDTDTPSVVGPPSTPAAVLADAAAVGAVGNSASSPIMMATTSNVAADEAKDKKT